MRALGDGEAADVPIVPTWDFELLKNASLGRATDTPEYGQTPKAKTQIEPQQGKKHPKNTMGPKYPCGQGLYPACMAAASWVVARMRTAHSAILVGEKNWALAGLWDWLRRPSTFTRTSMCDC